MSAHQIHRIIGVMYKTARLMCHRIRDAMIEICSEPLDGNGMVLEVNENFMINTKLRFGSKKDCGVTNKGKIFTFIERYSKARSYHEPVANTAALSHTQLDRMKASSQIMTDTAGQYCRTREKPSNEFEVHGYVDNRLDGDVRGETSTNTIESCIAFLKCGFVGAFHHVSPALLKRYIEEYNHRFINRQERGTKAIFGNNCKRLMHMRGL